MELWGENRQNLGLFPRDAFIERARRPGILGYIGADGVLRGYLLYYVSRRGIVRVVHLCVDRCFRRRGIASILVSDLMSRRQAHWRMVKLRCRLDYDHASPTWPKHGFFAFRELAGRGKNGATLIGWRFEFPVSGEFPSLHLPHKLHVVSDNNVFALLQSNDRTHSDVAGLNEPWLRDNVHLTVTPEHFNELLRHDSPEFRSGRRQALAWSDHVVADYAAFRRMSSELRDLFPPKLTASHQSDLFQLSWAAASSAFAFLTTDERLLKRAVQIEHRVGLLVIRPCDLINEVSRSLNDEHFRAVVLGAAREIRERRLSRDNEVPWSFLTRETGKPKKKLKNDVHDYLSRPAFCECRIVEDANGTPLATYVLERLVGIHKIPHLIVAKGRRSSAMVRRILVQRVKSAAASGALGLVVQCPFGDQHLSQPCRDLGFIKFDDGFVKPTLNGTLALEQIHGRLLQLSGEAPGALPRLLLGGLPEESLNEAALASLEHRCWPGKIQASAVPTYIISIHPSYAQHLFEERLAARMLFTPDTDLALNTEGVYYSGRTIRLTAPARILWYIKKSSGIGESGTISACSRLVEARLGSARELYKKWEQLGVYDWPHLMATAKSDPNRRLLAIRFDDQETFSRPVRWNDAVPILRRNGYEGGPPQGPRETTSAAFLDIYNLGCGRPSGGANVSEAAIRGGDS